jgi:hypothetical protein
MMVLVACSARPAETVVVPPPAEPVMAEPGPALHPEDRDLVERVADVAARDGARGRRETAELLVSFARDILSSEWRDARRREVAVKLGRQSLPIDAAELERALDDHQTKHLRPVLRAMEALREPAIVAYAFELCEDERQALRRRQLALAVLQKHVERDDVDAFMRLRVASDRLATLEAANGPSVQ